MARIRLTSLAAAALLGAGLVAGCGGGGDEDPQQVLDETFSNERAINSGVLDLSLSGSAEGEEGGSLDASLSGPFQGEQGKQGEFPQLDLTASLGAEGGGQSIDFEGGLIATSDEAFVSYRGTDYEVPQRLFNQVKRVSERGQSQSQEKGQEGDAGAIFKQLGIDPSKWLTNLKNEGDEDVEGTNTIRIHGDANVPQILEDLRSASDRAGAADAPKLTPAQISEVEDAVQEASIDVYSGKDDRILRRLDLKLDVSPPEGTGATVDNLDLEFSLAFGDVNEEQTIEAPSDAQPFDQLLQDLGLPSALLEGALGGGDSFNGGAIGGGDSFGGGAIGGGSGGGSGGGKQDAYFECLQKAQSPDELQACADKL